MGIYFDFNKMYLFLKSLETLRIIWARVAARGAMPQTRASVLGDSMLHCKGQ